MFWSVQNYLLTHEKKNKKNDTHTLAIHDHTTVIMGTVLAHMHIFKDSHKSTYLPLFSTRMVPI